MRPCAGRARGENRAREKGAYAAVPVLPLAGPEAAAWNVEQALSEQEAEAGKRVPRRPGAGPSRDDTPAPPTAHHPPLAPRPLPGSPAGLLNARVGPRAPPPRVGAGRGRKGAGGGGRGREGARPSQSEALGVPYSPSRHAAFSGGWPPLVKS